VELLLVANDPGLHQHLRDLVAQLHVLPQQLAVAKRPAPLPDR
jgi:hypothetical protein